MDAKNIELRSKEVQDIMGKMPPSILRWATIAILFILVGLLIGSYFYHYPETLHGQIVIAPNKEIKTNEMVRGIAQFPIYGSGKLLEGQKVQVRLMNFPENEYGYLTGRIKTILSTPNAKDQYQVIVIFPNGLITNSKQRLPANIELRGTAEIVVKDVRLLDRIIH